MNMIRKSLLAALAVTVFSACSDQFADTPPVVNAPQLEEGTPIMFGPMSKGSTRADITGADAADLLDSKFVVLGFKGSSTASVGSIVFDNYLVVYEENTANTTESNTANWEYVGKGRIKHAIDNGITSQAMKYWDYSQSQYDFIAWSTGKKTPIYEGNPTDGQVLVSAINPSTLRTAAYTYKGKSADLMGCYIADIVTRQKAQYGGQPVTIKFRSLGSKVRMGIYETVPGYSVRDVEFYYEPSTASRDNRPKLFTTNTSGSLIYNEGTYTVYYPVVGDESNPGNNQAHVSFSGTGSTSTLVNFGDLNLFIAEEGEKSDGAVFIGRSSNAASMAGEAEGNYFTQYLPNENGMSLNLRVNYVLESIAGSGETIEVKGATAQVPSIYTQWKAGYAYTYLFKISDKTNGYTGPYDPWHPDGSSASSDPAGLYPITFDAVVVNSEDEDQAQETITLVSTPSITTYQEGQTVVDNSEYLSADDKPIYVTVGENDALLALNASNAAVYSLSAAKECTEADIVDALTYRSESETGYIRGRNDVFMAKENVDYVSTIQRGVDGTPIELGDVKAASFTALPGTYAFVYTKTAPSSPANILQQVSVPLGMSVAGLFRDHYITGVTGDVQKGEVYFTQESGLKEKVFYGQTVNNLYTRSGASPYVYTPASGYAVTGTDYYYTTNNGISYTKAVNIAYASFKSTDLYTFDGTTYSLKSSDLESTADGTSYYQKDGDTYTYCVILPEQVDGLLVLDKTRQDQCADSEIALKGQTYYEIYYRYLGEYYTKIIKVVSQ